MISFLVAGAIGLTALQAGIDGPRESYVTCLRTAFDTAMSQKVAAADYGAFLQTSCGPQADRLRSGLIGFDVKNGIKRSQAAADAQAQIDDYVAIAQEKYEFRSAAMKPKGAPAPAAAPAAPPPTPAAAPKN